MQDVLAVAFSFYDSTERHVVIGSHCQGFVCADSFVGVCLYEVECSNADEFAAFGVSCFPGLGAEDEEAEECADEHLEECSFYRCCRGDCEVVEIVLGCKVDCFFYGVGFHYYVCVGEEEVFA